MHRAISVISISLITIVKNPVTVAVSRKRIRACDPESDSSSSERVLPLKRPRVSLPSPRKARTVGELQSLLDELLEPDGWDGSNLGLSE